MDTQRLKYNPSYKYISVGIFVLLAVYLNILLLKYVLTLYANVSVVAYLVPWTIALPQFFLGVFIFAGIKTGHITSKTINFRKPTYIQIVSSIFLLGVNFIFIYLYVIFIAILGIEIFMPTLVPPDILGDGFVVYINLITICFLVPILEELFFRGFLFNAFLGKFRLIYAIFLSSGIFAIMHGSIGFFVPLFFSSIMISFLYYKAKTIWAPVITHSLQNLFVVLVALAA